MAEPASKKRRVRKGTRSCWECRRRKIKCRFLDENASTCINCIDYDTPCVSQVDADGPGITPARPSQTPSNSTEPPATENDGLARRIERLEELMLKVVDGDERRQLSTKHHEAEDGGGKSHPCAPPGDLFDGSAVRNAHDIAASNSSAYNKSLLTPESASPALHRDLTAVPASPSSYPGESVTINSCFDAQQRSLHRRYQQIARDLHALLPSPQLRNVLAFESPGASMILNFAHSRDDLIAGRTEPHWSLASASWPSPDTHPVLLAKRLLQYSICMQHLPPNFDPSRLEMPAHQQACELVSHWVAAAAGVTSDDEMIGCGEGIEILILLSMFQAEAGHLRRAWMTTRRAMELARLLGIDRAAPPPVRSCTTPNDPKTTPSMSILWYRLNCNDRYHSIILGLAPGSHKDNFLNVTPISSNGALDKLSKAHAVICKSLADRNDLPPRSAESYSVTQSIESEFEQAASYMGSSWWDIPVLPKTAVSDLTYWRRSTSQLMAARCTMYAQVRHYTLLILLHLPYLLRDIDGGKHNSNRLACMTASRAVLERFVVFRKGNIVNIAGRPIDYSALIAGMTLLLGHLGQGIDNDVRQSDQGLIESVLITFRDLGTYKRDRLASESAETLSQLLPIVMSENQEPVSLTVPFLGTVNINPRPTTAAAAYNAVHNSEDFAESMALQQPLLGDFDFDPQPVLSFEAPGMAQVNFSAGIGEAADSSMEYRMPYPSSNLEDWVFQGIDTTYWSTLNESINGMAWE